MTANLPPPADPAIYHITHLDNLAGILRERGLWCDAQRIARGFANTNIGHKHIKARRLARPVPTPPGGHLGDYVPFNFCPRSVMLYAVNRGHNDYGGGQTSVVHLVSSVKRAAALGRPWAFTDRHAELAHALYYNDVKALVEVPWNTMAETYWKEVKEERQAEFLVHQSFPWEGIAAIGVISEPVKSQVEYLISGDTHRPKIVVKPEWYY